MSDPALRGSSVAEDLSSLDMSSLATAPRQPEVPLAARVSSAASSVSAAADRLRSFASSALFARSAADAIETGIVAAVLRAPLTTGAVTLLVYIVWLPLGAAVGALATVVSSPVAALFTIAFLLAVAGFVARALVFPGSVGGFTLSSERQYASRLRLTADGAARELSVALLRAVAAARTGGSGSSAARLLAPLRIRARPQPARTDEDLLTISAPPPPPPTLIPAANTGPLAELVALRDLLTFSIARASSSAAAGIGVLAPPPARPAQHATVLLHYLTLAIDLVQACERVLTATSAASGAGSVDPFNDPLPIESAPPLVSPLSTSARAAISTVPSTTLMLSPWPLRAARAAKPAIDLQEIRIGDDGSTGSAGVANEGGGTGLLSSSSPARAPLVRLLADADNAPIHVPSLALTAAAAVAALARFRELSVWLEVLPHAGWGANTALESVARASCDVSEASDPDAALPPQVALALSRARASVHAEWVGSFTSSLPTFVQPAVARASLNNAAQSPSPADAGDAQLGPLAAALGVQPSALRTAVQSVENARTRPPSTQRSEGASGGAGATPFSSTDSNSRGHEYTQSLLGEVLSGEAASQEQRPGEGLADAYFASLMSPLRKGIRLARRAVRYAWVMFVSEAQPSPVAGFPLLRSELEMRLGAVTLAIPVCDCSTGGGHGAACDGRYVDALFVPAATAAAPLVAWTGADGFAPTRDVDGIDVSRLLGAASDQSSGHEEESPTSTTLSLCRRRGGSGLAAAYPASPPVGDEASASPDSQQTGLIAALRRTIVSLRARARSNCVEARWAAAASERAALAARTCPSKTLALLCAPNAGIFETSLRHADALRFYTATLGCDVLLWNYPLYGRQTLPKSRVPTGGWLRSRAPRDGISPDALAKDAFAVAAFATSALGAKHFIAHGESMGGTCAVALADAGVADVVVADRTFDSLYTTASEMMGAWASPALWAGAGWSAGARSRGNAAAAVGGLTRSGTRLRALIVANDAADSVIATRASLATALCTAASLGQDSNGAPLEPGWPGEDNVSGVAASARVRVRRSAQSAATALSSVRTFYGALPRAPTIGAPLTAPSALSVLPFAIREAASSRAESLFALLVYLTHEILWRGDADGMLPTAVGSAASASELSALSRCIVREGLGGAIEGDRASSLGAAAVRSLMLSGASVRPATADGALLTAFETLREPTPSLEATTALISVATTLVVKFEATESSRARAAAVRSLHAHAPPALRATLARAVEIAAGGDAGTPASQRPAGDTLTASSVTEAARAALAACDAAASDAALATASSDASLFVELLVTLQRDGGPLRSSLPPGGLGWAGGLLLALAGMSNGCGLRLGEAAVSDGVDGVRAWLAGGLRAGWPRSTVSSVSELRTAGAAAQRAAVLARAGAAVSTSSSLAEILADVVGWALRGGANAGGCREAAFVSVAPPSHLSPSSAPHGDAWLDAASAARPWSTIDVALRRASAVAASSPIAGAPPREHRARVVDEVRAALQALVMLRAAAADALDAADGSADTAAPALVFIPLACGHNQPWAAQEAAQLAVVMRRAVPEL